ncbi:hypothetical protein [Solicola gregarius]|uniref:Uncharacterized protein n=1 Tax=Solicola gregarius TaxID=2908642 RepID=A0AA46YK05_9ACTN|nr:hypothetical protein [Solicola gregarius]UYM04932.1 hypothetical protein L0C25_20790 [Solicola gregarius]
MRPSDETIHRLRDLLQRAAHEPHTITLLTDEELVAIEHIEAATPHPTPWVADTRGVSRELAGRFGVRSLLARGLLRETNPVPGADRVLDVPPEVRVVLDTRRIGLGYVRAVRPQNGTGSSKIVVVQPELGAFEEDISVQGFHLFSACNYDDAATRLARWCVPVDGPRTGGMMEIATHEWPQFLYVELPDAKVTDLNVEVLLPDHRGERDPEQWLIAYSDRIALLACPSSASTLAVRPLTTNRLRELIDDRIASARRYAQVSSPRGS